MDTDSDGLQEICNFASMPDALLIVSQNDFLSLILSVCSEISHVVDLEGVTGVGLLKAVSRNRFPISWYAYLFPA